MKTLILFLLTLISSSSVMSHSPNGPSLFFLPSISDEQVESINLNDGSLEDWSKLLDPAFILKSEEDYFLNISTSGSTTSDSIDLDFVIYIAWHRNSNRIYVGFQKEDDIYIESDFKYQLNPMELNDVSVQFMIDSDHSGEEYGFSQDCCDSEADWMTIYNKQAQYYLASPIDIDGQYLSLIGAGAGWANTFPYANAGGRIQNFTNSTRSVVEFYITPFKEVILDNPSESQITSLENEHILGFQVSVPDFDDLTGTPESFYTLLGEATTWRNADRFVDGYLLDLGILPSQPGECFALSGCGETDSHQDSTTAISTQNWARIKMSLYERKD